LLGAFAALTGQVTLDSVIASIQAQFKGRVAEGNIMSAQVAHQWVMDHVGHDDEGAHGGIAHVEVEHPSTAELPLVIAGSPEVTNA
jgi:hypothetical protein